MESVLCALVPTPPLPVAGERSSLADWLCRHQSNNPPVSLTVQDRASGLMSAHESAAAMDAAELILFELTSIMSSPNKEYVQGHGGYNDVF